MFRSLTWFTAAYWVAVLAVLPWTTLDVDAAAWLGVLAPGVISSGVLALYSRARGFLRVQALAQTLLFHILLLFPVTAVVYTSMQLPFAFADEQLAAMDAALGFDWKTTIAFIDERRWLANLFTIVYGAFTPQMVLYPMLLAFGNDRTRGYKMLMSYGLIILLSSIVAATAPAIGTFAAHGINQARNINLTFALDFVPHLEQLKSGPVTFTPYRLAGIISFPSVHAAVAVLCAWAWWNNKVLRYPVLVINMLMAASAVPNGGHYLVDVLAGIAVAAWAIMVVDRLSARVEARSATQTLIPRFLRAASVNS